MRVTSIIAFSLVIIGALIWGMVGIFNFNLVSFLFGAGNDAVVSRIIYSVVGISALWLLFYGVSFKPFKSIS